MVFEKQTNTFSVVYIENVWYSVWNSVKVASLENDTVDFICNWVIIRSLRKVLLQCPWNISIFHIIKNLRKASICISGIL